MTREIDGIYGTYDTYGGDAESNCCGPSVCPARGKCHDTGSDHRIRPVRGAADPICDRPKWTLVECESRNATRPMKRPPPLRARFALQALDKLDLISNRRTMTRRSKPRKIPMGRSGFAAGWVERPGWIALLERKSIVGWLRPVTLGSPAVVAGVRWLPPTRGYHDVRSDEDCRRLIAALKKPVLRGCFTLICGPSAGVSQDREPERKLIRKSRGAFAVSLYSVSTRRKIRKNAVECGFMRRVLYSVASSTTRKDSFMRGQGSVSCVDLVS
jgi:hypothetical protein